MASLATYRVVHEPKVAIRDTASTSSKVIGVKQTGEIFRAAAVIDGWVQLEDGKGWMMIDGAKLNLGMLLEEVMPDGSPKSQTSSQLLVETSSQSDLQVPPKGTNGNDASRLTTPAYRVVYEPKVAVRMAPSTSAGVVDIRLAGTTVHAVQVKDGWIELQDGKGWMLIDGTSVGLGILLEAVPFHPKDAGEEDPSEEKERACNTPCTAKCSIQ